MQVGEACAISEGIQYISPSKEASCVHRCDVPERHTTCVKSVGPRGTNECTDERKEEREKKATSHFTHSAGLGRKTASSSSKSLTRAFREFLSCRMSFSSGRLNRGRSGSSC